VPRPEACFQLCLELRHFGQTGPEGNACRRSLTELQHEFAFMRAAQNGLFKVSRRGSGLP